MLNQVIKNVQVCIPFMMLCEKHLPMVIRHRINPEIGLDGDVIDTCSPKALAEVASVLRQEGLGVTLHGPFYDLVPGGLDKTMVKATRRRLRQTFDLIPLFEPKSIVCHTGFDRKRYHEVRDQWLDTSVQTWSPLVDDLGNTRTVLVLENVYEKTPTMLERLLKALDSDQAGFCFDTGHMNAFSDTAMQGWLESLGPFLKQMHLHDNNGIWDDHLALGNGNIDFDTLFRHMELRGLRPIITLEAHQEDWVWDSLNTLSRSAPFLRLISRT
ncbi:MAG: sugar phosphate isomerase/epimerase [Deltaproteobacteria bacterium]|nr:sugar phosphate isomerase/epimerase [Deltaproteobacteria bacterium]